MQDNLSYFWTYVLGNASLASKYSYLLNIGTQDKESNCCQLNMGVFPIDMRRELVWGDETACGFSDKFIRLCLETEGISEESKRRGMVYTLTVKDTIRRSEHLLPVHKIEIAKTRCHFLACTFCGQYYTQHRI